MDQTIKEACDRILVRHISDGLKRVIDDMLTKGVDARAVLARVRTQAGRNSLTALTAEAYLESLRT